MPPFGSDIRNFLTGVTLHMSESHKRECDARGHAGHSYASRDDTRGASLSLVRGNYDVLSVDDERQPDDHGHEPYARQKKAHVVDRCIPRVHVETKRISALRNSERMRLRNPVLLAHSV